MTVLRVSLHILMLYLLFFIGNLIQDAFQLFIPGSVLGMLLLFFLLKSNLLKLKWIEEGTSLLLRHLTLFFIPVTIGIINYLELFTSKGILLVLAAVVSTALVMGVSVMISERMAKREESQHKSIIDSLSDDCAHGWFVSYGIENPEENPIPTFSTDIGCFRCHHSDFASTGYSV